MRVVFLVALASLLLASIAICCFLGGQGTFQPGVDVSGRTAGLLRLLDDSFSLQSLHIKSVPD